MKIKLLSIDNSKSETIEISDKLVKLRVNHKLIKFVIDWQLNHLKPRTAKTPIVRTISCSNATIAPKAKPSRLYASCFMLISSILER